MWYWGYIIWTRMDEKCPEPTKVYADPDEVARAHNAGALKLHDKIKVRVKSTSYDKEKVLITEQGIYDTTVGRLVFFNIVPDGIEFSLINKTMKHKGHIRYHQHKSQTFRA